MSIRFHDEFDADYDKKDYHLNGKDGVGVCNEKGGKVRFFWRSRV